MTRSAWVATMVRAMPLVRNVERIRDIGVKLAWTAGRRPCELRTGAPVLEKLAVLVKDGVRP